MKEIFLATPYGFCAGVERAVSLLESVLDQCRSTVYVYHGIVHNESVIRYFKSRGVIFVEALSEVPDGALVVFSAHGVPAALFGEAERRKIRVIDASCPLVVKVHRRIQGYAQEDTGCHIVVIGNPKHQEVIGTIGQLPENRPFHVVRSVDDVKSLPFQSTDRIAYVTQTTLSVMLVQQIIATLCERFSNVRGSGLSDICYATHNRQNAVQDLCKVVDFVLVIGSQNSSNSKNLCQIVQQHCRREAMLCDAVTETVMQRLYSTVRLGVTAGASVSESLVQEALLSIQKRFRVPIYRMSGMKETVSFKMPVI